MMNPYTNSLVQRRRRRLFATMALGAAFLLVDLCLVPGVFTRRLHVPQYKTFVDEEGTLQVGRKPEPIPCRYFVGSRGTPRINQTTAIKKLHYHFDDCAEHQLGNRLGEHYLNYMVANAARIPYQMSCGDSLTNNSTVQIIDPTHEKKMHESVLRHLAVDLTSPGPVPLDTWGGQAWDTAVACNHCSRGGWWCDIGLNTMADIIIQDMQKLAQTAVGQSFEPDDAVIHLRLGDALKGTHDEGIGLLPHGAYVQLLRQVQNDSNAPLTSIGIVTQSFKRANVRSFDLHEATLQKSKLVALDLVAYLKEQFPTASVSIHNDETPLHSYSRLIRAKRAAICGPSTFCTMPVLAVDNSTAKGFLFRAKRHSPWARHVAQYRSHLESYKVPRLANNYSAVLSGKEIIHWLRHQEPHAGDFVIAEAPLVRNNNIAADGGAAASAATTTTLTK